MSFNTPINKSKNAGSLQGLSQQVEAYDEWKNHLKTEIQHYQHWLEENHLNSDDIHQRLMRGLTLLQDDELTIAFVGEYSRGKTELINALVFSDFGQRMLPSQAGRTTMCPTEIFYDAKRTSSYLKLLPIETRIQDQSISEYKTDPGAWHEIPIDISDPEKMSFSLKQLASTRTATLLEARSLGFDDRMLDHDPDNTGKVIIPVWRHAMISLDSPLLRKGLRVLDTPGLNALGSEPELTVSMIPKAQAIVFVLSVDTGVTASDKTIWNKYINVEGADHRAGRFAVLNKIDILWDDLQGETHTQASIEKVRKTSASHLNMPIDDVIPLSAKQGLIGRVKKDDLLLQKSALPKLEKLISKRILAQKEALIYDTLIGDVVGMLKNSQSILNERLSGLYQGIESLTTSNVSPDELQTLADKTHNDHDLYYKKLITLKSSRRLMQSQGEILQQLMTGSRFDDIVQQTRKDLQDSWSTLGMIHAMSQFFVKIEKDIVNVAIEARLADKMVSAIYQRFTVDINTKYLKPRTFSIKVQQKQLIALKAKSAQFRRQPKILVTEQSILIQRFFNTFVAEARLLQQQIMEEAVRWPDEALLPLMQYALEQKNLLEGQVANLKAVAKNNRSVKSQQTELEKMIDVSRMQLVKAEQIEQALSQPPPSQNDVFQGIAN
ncbi:MAG: GTPase SAR1 family protein [Oleiphilaceae bacterium]|jgi:GTPase SAR1 family protein